MYSNDITNEIVAYNRWVKSNDSIGDIIFVFVNTFLNNSS